MSTIVNRLIAVSWELKTLDQVLELHGDEDYGLYQVYAQHVVFGPGSLVYVGKAVDQSFGRRFQQHQRWLADENGVSIRVGRLNPADHASGDEWDDWKKCVSYIESLTIYWHSPPYNSKSIQSYVGDPLWVQNWGDRGGLLPEYSSHWKRLRPDEDETRP